MGKREQRLINGEKGTIKPFMGYNSLVIRVLE